MRFLLKDKRVDWSQEEQYAFRRALPQTDIEMMQLLLIDDRVVMTKDSILRADKYQHSLNALFAAAGSRFWPRVIGNDSECLPRKKLILAIEVGWI